MKKLLIIFAACIAVLAGTAQAAGLDSAKEKLTAFGIIDKSYDTGAELTRAEFADIIARFFPEDTLDYSKDNKFRDVTTQHELAGSVNKAAHYGIMGGVGNGMFAPDEAVTREQIGIAMVRLLGYNLKAELAGGYSAGYAQTAASLRLTDGVKADMTTAGAAVIMADNALSAYITEDKLSGENEVSVSKDKTLMNSALSIYKESGVLNGAGMKAIDERYQEDAASVIVGDLRLDADADKMSLYSDYAGRYIDAYYREDSAGEKTLVWFECRKTTETTVRLRDIVSIDGQTVTYKKNDTRKTLRLEQLPYVIYNNRPTTAIPELGGNGFITFINPGGGYTTVEIRDYATYVAESVSEAANSISTKLPEGAIKLDDYDWVEIINADRTALALKKIEDGDILSVLVSLDGDSIEIVRSTDSVDGRVENVDFTEMEITINGEDYPCTAQFMEKLALYRLSDVLSYSGSFRLDAAGAVAWFDMELDTGRHIGYLMKILLTDTEEDTRPIVRILTDTGDIKDFRMRVKNDMITVDGAATTPADFKNNNTSAGGVFAGRIITYSQNSKGEVRELDNAAQTAGKGLYQYATVTSARYRRSELSFYNEVMLSEDAVIFHVPKEDKYKNDNRCYALLTTGSFNDNGTYKDIKFYAFDKDAISADAVVCEWSIEGDSSNAYPMMVSKITSGINEDDDSVEYMSGEMYTGAVSAQSFVGDTLKRTTSSIKGTIDETDVGKGDIVLCNPNFFGNASDAKLIYDCSEDTYYQDNPYMLNDYQLTYILGTVWQRDGKILKVKLAGTSKYQYYRVDTDKIFTVTNAADGSPSIEPGTIGDIKTSKSYGADASRVFIHASYNKPVFIVIYNN